MTKAANILKIFEDEMPADMMPPAADGADAGAAPGADPIMDAAQGLADKMMGGEKMDEQGIMDYMADLKDMPDADKMMVMAKAMVMMKPEDSDDAEPDADADDNGAADADSGAEA